jgi:O-antigen/teichoic acid export membrane protein
MVKSVGTGLTNLFAGKLVSRVIGLLGGLILLRFLHPEEYGLIAIVMATVAVFGLLSEIRLGDATTRFIARYLRDERMSEVRDVAYVSLGFQLSIGLAITFLTYLSAEPLAAFVGKPEISGLARIGAFGILGNTLVAYSIAALLGLNRTKEYATVLIFQGILGAVLPLILVLQGFGVEGALTGMIVSWIGAGAVGTIYVLIRVRRSGPKGHMSSGVPKIFREILKFSAPLWVANLFKIGRGRYFGLLMAVFLTAQEAGNYAAALTLFAVLGYFSFPVKEIIYPIFSRIDAKTESTILRSAFEKAVRYSTLVILPLGLLMLLLARPAISLLIPRYFDSAFYLGVLILLNLSSGLGIKYALKVLKAQGETKLTAWLTALNLVVGVVAGILLIPTYKVVGLILAENLAILLPSIIMFMKTSRRYDIRPPFKAVAPIYASTALMSLLVYLLLMLPLGEFGSIIGGLAVGIPLYLLFATQLKALNTDDVSVFRTAFGHIPIFGRFAGRLLTFIEFLLRR